MQTTQQKKLLNITLRRDELGRTIGGGLPANSLILLEGPDGAGKSLLAQRVTYGLLDNNQTVSYLSTELNTQGYIEQMASLNYDIKYDLLDEKLFFISLFPFYGKGTLKTKNFLDTLLECKELFRSEVIIFDTLSFLLVDDNLSQEDAFLFLTFLKRLNSLGKTVLVAVDPKHINQHLLNLIRSSCDIILELQLREFAGQPVRVISVKRFKRAGGEVTSAIPFRVEPGKGLVIEIVSFS
ncbi:MAG: ATPase domain-containing protein [Candidatus Woesearchaeota archaeon]